MSPKCETCQVLKEALDYERARTKELIDTLTAILKPAPQVQEIKNNLTAGRIASPAGMTFTRRRAELEKADRARLEAEKHAAKPDKKIEEIEKLERELDISPSDSILNSTEQ